MDLYNPERHLVYAGTVWRKVRAENGFGSDKWQEVSAHLLDNFCELIWGRCLETSSYDLSSYPYSGHEDTDWRREESHHVEGTLLS